MSTTPATIATTQIASTASPGTVTDSRSPSTSTPSTTPTIDSAAAIGGSE